MVMMGQNLSRCNGEVAAVLILEWSADSLVRAVVSLADKAVRSPAQDGSAGPMLSMIALFRSWAGLRPKFFILM